MFSKPATHLLVGPGPFEGMGIELVVFWPSRFDMVDQCLATWPGATFQVMVAESVIEQFGLIEPGGMDRREAWPPPGVVFDVLTGGGGGMTGIAILDQEDAAEMSMALMKPLQSLDVMGGIFVRGAVGFHLTAMHHQKHQHVDRAMTNVFKLLLLNGAGNGPADRGAFERLQIWHLIDTNNPKAFMHQMVGVSITPENLLRAVLELGVQVRRFPIAGAMRLQIHCLQDTSYGAGADRRHYPLAHRLAG